MDSKHIEALIKLYKRALLLLWIAFGLAAAGLAQTIIRNVTNPNFAGNIFEGAGLGWFASPFVAIIGDLIALPGMLQLYKSAKSLKELSPDAARERYEKMWGFQSFVGGIVTAGAIVMIPGSLFLLQMLMPGLAIVFPLYAGTWIHLRARKINREIVTGKTEPENDKTKNVDNQPVEPEKLESAYKPSKNAKQNSGSVGAVPLAISIILAALNVLIEFGTYTNLRNNPEFDPATGVIPYPDSMYLGLAQLVDIAVFGSIGVVMLVLAIKGIKQMPRKRFITIAVLTAVNLVIYPGTTSVWLVQATGSSDTALQGQQDGKDSIATVKYLQSQPLPQGFDMINEYYEGFPNTSWRTGVYNLPEANIEATCQQVIDYAITYGADMWKADPQTAPKAFDGSGDEVKACVATMENYPKLAVQVNEVWSQPFMVYGNANFGAHSPVKFELSLLKYGPNWEVPNSWGYEFKIGTWYTEDLTQIAGGLSQGTIEFNQLLQDFGQARLSQPDRNPTDPAFVQEVLDNFQYKIKIQIVETSPGVANRLDVTNSEGTRLCLSIDKWDDPGVPDPGTGYGLGFMENLKVLKGFGNAVEGSCKK